MNIVLNAVDAMEGSGELGVATSLGRGGRKVIIRISDTGKGIPPDVMPFSFEPFFTTKRAGRGTGLGLALVHSIVKEHGGAIDLESEVGKGTTFTVWLPRLDGTAVAVPGGETPVRGQGQVVLIVDDEPEVLAALEEMLATLGYEPAGYTDSRAALEAFRADPPRFEAVISDEVMPGLAGTQLAAELRRVNPAIPFASPSLGGLGICNYVTNKCGDPADFPGIGAQLWIQFQGVLTAIVLSAVVSYVALLIVKAVTGVRVSEEEEREGLDTTYHGESAYKM